MKTIKSNICYEGYNLLRYKHRKAFTLIELIVVMVIISILVLLGAPKYQEHSREAQLTRIKVNIKELEQASQKYYMNYNKWPRLSDTPYTAIELEEYSERIYSITGEEVTLNPDGNYYEIDYDSIKNYVTIPNDKGNYILQNPIGRVYYLENLTEVAKGNLINYEPPKQSKPKPEQQVVFEGLGPEAFDGDTESQYIISDSSPSREITWEGNLDNKRINIVAAFSGSTVGYANISFKDSNGGTLSFIDLSGVQHTTLGLSRTKTIHSILVPEGAVKIVFSVRSGSSGSRAHVYEVYLAESLESPKQVSNITSTSTDSSITLEWKNTSTNYVKSAVFRDGEFVGFSTGVTYTDTPLYSSQDYTYEVQAINSYGNGSQKVSCITRTKTPEIIFRGLEPSAFDKDSSTSTIVRGDVTWEGNLANKKVTINLGAGSGPSQYWLYFRIYDVNNKQLKFVNLTDDIETNQLTGGTQGKIFEIIVPEDAVRFTVSSQSNPRLHDIYVSDSVESPNSVYAITSIPTDSSITLNWAQDDSNYEGVIIYRDDVFLKVVEGKSFIDKPLYSNSEHTYILKAINSYGNSSTEVSYTTSTTSPEIIFRGLEPSAFDKDNSTYSNVNGDVTWEGDLTNKKVVVDLIGTFYDTIYFRIYDINNKLLKFTNLTNNSEVDRLEGPYGKRRVYELIIPEDAVKFSISKGGNLYDIYVSDN